MEVLVSSGEYDLYVTGADGADIDFDTDTNTFTMPDQQVWISATSLRKMAWTTGILLDDFDQWDDAVYLYDAEHPTVTPTVVVMDGETALTRDADYILSITNNTGSAARMITATVTVTAVDGSGYVGANTKIFRITPFNIAGCTVGGKLEAYDDGYGPHYPLCENVEVWNGDTQLTLYTDYEIELDPDIDIYSYEVGQQYQATVKGTGDWGGAKTFTFTFVALHHTVVFDANGGAGTIASGTVANDGGYQGKYYLPECTFTAPAGKAFDHWEVNCGEETYELAYDEGKLFFSAPYIWNENDVKEITVTAIWKELPQHTVTVSGLEHGTLMENNVVALTLTDGTAQVYEGYTVSVVPDSGDYELRDLTVTDENNEPVPVTDSAFIMPAGDVTLSAVIVRLYGVTINITEGSAYGTLTADRTLAAQGDTVTLTVVPAAKYMPVINEETGMPVTVTGSDGENVWVHEDIVWIDEEPTPVPNTYMFTMPASNVTVSAAFVEAAYGINVTYVMEDEFYPSQNGSLAVTADGEPVTKVQGRYLANPDQEIAVTVSPAPGYALVEITGTYDNNYQNISGAALALTQDTSGPNRWTFTMPDGWPYLEARMRKLPVVTFMDGETEYASIPTDETGYVTPPADPTKEGWQFAAWHQVVDGEVSETPFNFNAEITEDITLKAVFDPMYTVTVDDADGGTVTADPETAVAGKAIALDIQPATGYVLTLLSLSDEFGNPATDSNGSPVTVEDEAFIMPANNVIVSAIFDLVSYSIDTHITGEGDVTAYVDGSFANKANYQDTVTLAVEPAEGYMLTSLTCSVDGGDAVAIENGQFTMPAGIVTVTAVFCPVFGDPDFTMPTALTTIEESAFEDLTNMKVVDASNVTTIGKWAFKGCTGLTQIRLDRDCDIDDLAFSGCGTVYVYAPADGETQAYCSKTTNPCVFVETDETLSSITGQEGPVYEFPSGSTLPSILP